jgi:hypothetical protein
LLIHKLLDILSGESDYDVQMYSVCDSDLAAYHHSQPGHRNVNAVAEVMTEKRIVLV